MVALSIIVFSIFLFIVLVILSLLVTIFFFCYVSGADLGAGLGLAIVEDLARMYGGKLTLEKSRLGGLNVSLMLPAV